MIYMVYRNSNIPRKKSKYSPCVTKDRKWKLPTLTQIDAKKVFIVETVKILKKNHYVRTKILRVLVYVFVAFFISLPEEKKLSCNHAWESTSIFASFNKGAKRLGQNAQGAVVICDPDNKALLLQEMDEYKRSNKISTV